MGARGGAYPEHEIPSMRALGWRREAGAALWVASYAVGGCTVERTVAVDSVDAGTDDGGVVPVARSARRVRSSDLRAGGHRGSRGDGAMWWRGVVHARQSHRGRRPSARAPDGTARDRPRRA